MKSYAKRFIVPFQMPGWSGRACGCTWSWCGSAWWPAGGGTAPSWATTPVVDDDGPGDQRLQRAELVRDQQHRAAAVHEGPRAPSANASWLTASTPAVGSSRTSSSGSAASARAIRVRCCCPPERVPTGVVARSVRPTAAQRRLDRGPVGRARRGAAVRGGPAGRTRRPRSRWPARRRRRRGAAARSRSGATAAASPGPARSTPNRLTVPASSGTRPSTVRIRVDLPEPLAPRMATTSPRPHGQVDAAQDRRGRRRRRPRRGRRRPESVRRASSAPQGGGRARRGWSA